MECEKEKSKITSSSLSLTAGWFVIRRGWDSKFEGRQHSVQFRSREFNDVSYASFQMMVSSRQLKGNLKLGGKVCLGKGNMGVLSLKIALDPRSFQL